MTAVHHDRVLLRPSSVARGSTAALMEFVVHSSTAKVASEEDNGTRLLHGLADVYALMEKPRRLPVLAGEASASPCLCGEGSSHGKGMPRNRCSRGLRSSGKVSVSFAIPADAPSFRNRSKSSWHDALTSNGCRIPARPSSSGMNGCGVHSTSVFASGGDRKPQDLAKGSLADPLLIADLPSGSWTVCRMAGASEKRGKAAC